MKPLHPLINPDSPHYDKEDGKVAIEELEKELSIREMIGFVKGNIFKYKWRMGAKDSEQKETRKIETYVAYQNELYGLLPLGIDDRISVYQAWEIAGKEWQYK